MADQMDTKNKGEHTVGAEVPSSTGDQAMDTSQQKQEQASSAAVLTTETEPKGDPKTPAELSDVQMKEAQDPGHQPTQGSEEVCIPPEPKPRSEKFVVPLKKSELITDDFDAWLSRKKNTETGLLPELKHKFKFKVLTPPPTNYGGNEYLIIEDSIGSTFKPFRIELISFNEGGLNRYEMDARLHEQKDRDHEEGVIPEEMSTLDLFHKAMDVAGGFGTRKGLFNNVWESFQHNMLLRVGLKEPEPTTFQKVKGWFSNLLPVSNPSTSGAQQQPTTAKPSE